MKKYLIGLALSGLAARMSKNARVVMPWQKRKSAPKRIGTFLLGAGVGAGVGYVLSQKPWR
jgi:hypothetical protein